MKLLTTPKQIDRLFVDLIQKYTQFDWLSAWGGISFDSYETFKSNQHKCRKVVIGTHFFQTHPDFIADVLTNTCVRFIKNTTALFHPKAYLFYNTDIDWKLLIGSANFTHGAFTTNAEIMFCLGSEDNEGAIIHNKFQKMVDHWWDRAAAFDKVELKRYRTAWRNMRTKRQALEQWSNSSNHKETKSATLLEARAFTMDWQTYVNEIKNSKTDLPMRLKFLDEVRELFRSHDSFSAMPPEARKYIAGTQNSFVSPLTLEDNLYSVWMAFGNMSGNGVFAGMIKANDKRISDALEYIPLEGAIIESDYNSFLALFLECFGGNPLATATRLLAMKRPDVFYCLTSANQKKFCKDFGIIRSHVTVYSYWSIVVERVQNCDWWLHPMPSGKEEKEIKRARVALLDSLYYNDFDL